MIHIIFNIKIPSEVWAEHVKWGSIYSNSFDYKRWIRSADNYYFFFFLNWLFSLCFRHASFRHASPDFLSVARWEWVFLRGSIYWCPGIPGRYFLLNVLFGQVKLATWPTRRNRLQSSTWVWILWFCKLPWYDSENVICRWGVSVWYSAVISTW